MYSTMKKSKETIMLLTPKNWIRKLTTEEEFAKIAKEYQQEDYTWEKLFIEYLDMGIHFEKYSL